MSKPYYLAYEERYKKVFAAGVEHWGHSPEDETLAGTLENWVKDNNLVGKKIIEFACGEGACGVVLSRLGCLYHGVDISPSAIEKASAALAGYPDARVSLLDMVKETTGEIYDAALDCMGFHMLVTDHERRAYLLNAYGSIKDGAPMLFFRESHKEGAYDGVVETYEQWKEISGNDYETPSLRCTKNGEGKEVEVLIPLVPGRARSRDGYYRELQSVGFVVEDFVKMEINSENPYSASIFVRKA